MTRVRIWNEPSASTIVEVPGETCPACEFARLAVDTRPRGTTMRGAIVHVELLDDWNGGADDEDERFPAGTIRRVEVVNDSPVLCACVTVSPADVERERESIRLAWQKKRRGQS